MKKQSLVSTSRDSHAEARKDGRTDAFSNEELDLTFELDTEYWIDKLPALPPSTFICLDVSGSMQSAASGSVADTTAVRCIDIAAFLVAGLLRKNSTAEVIPFTGQVLPLPRPLSSVDSVIANAAVLAGLPSGGTSCSAPLRYLNERGKTADLVVFISDDRSWSDFAEARTGTGTRLPTMSEEWMLFRTCNANARLVLIDLRAHGTARVTGQPEALQVGGFSDAIFRTVSLFANGDAS